MSDRSPDPVREAEAYRQHILSLLSADDPATVQVATASTLKEMIAAAGSDLGTEPGPGEWSLRVCLAHFVDAEIAASGRYRWILTSEEPALPGYDQDLWVDRTHSADETAEQMLSVWEPLRRANLRLWERSTEADRRRVGMHQERGPESYDLTFRLIAGHDRFHLAQMRRTLQAISGPGVTPP